jgi:hypothetical protein
MTVESRDGAHELSVEVDRLVIAGWAGRNREAMEHHIAELEALGIARPKATPMFYRVSAARLTTASPIQVVGHDSSGEAETVIFAVAGRHYVGLGSDHTDRKVEAYGVTVSKQICDKPVAARLWPLDEVMSHWDRLILRSEVVENDAWIPYQQGTVAELLAPSELIGRFTGGASLPDGTAMFGGTLPAIGGVRASARFRCELADPVLGRTIALGYDSASLENVG